MRAVSLWLRRKHQLPLALAFRRFSTSNSKVKIFDRELKRTQRDRAAWLTPSHDPLLHTVAQNLLDRLQDCKKTFPTALCLGGSLQPITRSLSAPPAPGGVEKLIVMDASYDMLQACKNAHHNATVETHFLVADEDSVDLVVSCLGLHWTNDLPGAMIQSRLALKPDGLFLAAILGGETLK
ncbi:putative methyltransferase, mitochondrial [Glycine soja]|nr:putative methyltransferase, mitochondrial [Glycine max]